MAKPEFDAQELERTPNHAELQGKPLLDLLRKTAEKLGHNKARTAQEIGIAPSYLTTILKGMKPVQNLSHEVLRQMAAYCEVPTLVIYCKAGLINAEDSVWKPSAEEQLEVFREQADVDPSCTGHVPDRKTWEKWPLQAKIWIQHEHRHRYLHYAEHERIRKQYAELEQEKMVLEQHFIEASHELENLRKKLAEK